MKKCIPASPYVVFGTNVVLHSLILFTFLTVFFTVFVTKLMKNAFDNQLSKLIENNTNTMIDKLDENTKNRLSLAFKYMPVDKLIKQYEKPSKYIIEHNNWVKTSAVSIIVFGIILMVLTLWLLYYSCGQCVNLGSLIKENIIVFAFVAIVEYIFFTNIALKFIPVPPSLLINTIIDKFKNTLA